MSLSAEGDGGMVANDAEGETGRDLSPLHIPQNRIRVSGESCRETELSSTQSMDETSASCQNSVDEDNSASGRNSVDEDSSMNFKAAWTRIAEQSNSVDSGGNVSRETSHTLIRGFNNVRRSWSSEDVRRYREILDGRKQGVADSTSRDLARKLERMVPCFENLPEGWLADYLHHCLNFHPLLCLLWRLTDPHHPLRWTERLSIELNVESWLLATSVLVTMFCHEDLDDDINDDAGCGKPQWLWFWVYTTLFVTVPSILMWWILYALYVCPCLQHEDRCTCCGPRTRKSLRCFGQGVACPSWLVSVVLAAFAIICIMLYREHERLRAFIYPWLLGRLQALLFFFPFHALVTFNWKWRCECCCIYLCGKWSADQAAIEDARLQEPDAQWAYPLLTGRGAGCCQCGCMVQNIVEDPPHPSLCWSLLTCSCLCCCPGCATATGLPVPLPPAKEAKEVKGMAAAAASARPPGTATTAQPQAVDLQIV